MKKLLTATALILSLCLAAPLAFGAPLMTLPQAEFDFGYVPQNSKISHVFWIHAAGDDSLKILKVVPG
jgi:hypothetical protein